MVKKEHGDKNPFYGKHHKEETKKKIGENRIGKPNNNISQKISIMIEGIKYNSYGDASRALNLPLTTIWCRCKSKNKKFSNYTIIEKENK